MVYVDIIHGGAHSVSSLDILANIKAKVHLSAKEELIYRPRYAACPQRLFYPVERSRIARIAIESVPIAQIKSVGNIDKVGRFIEIIPLWLIAKTKGAIRQFTKKVDSPKTARLNLIDCSHAIFPMGGCVFKCFFNDLQAIVKAIIYRNTIPYMLCL